MQSGDNFIVYWDDKGNFISCGGRQAAVLHLLDKLGLKSVPIKNCTMWTTTWTSTPGNYTITYDISNGCMTANVYVQPAVSCSSFVIDEVKIDDEPALKSKKPTKDMRRQWRQAEKMHSRNTGRRIGRR